MTDRTLVRLWNRLPEPARRAALALAAIQALLIAGHVAIFLATSETSDRQILDFNQEWSIPTWWSAIVALLAATAAASVWRRSRLSEWALLAVGFAGVGAEELVQLHEWLDGELGIDWPILYAPLLFAGAYAIVRVAGRLPAPLRLLLLAGLGAMGVSIVLELLGNLDDGSSGTRNLIEENLELLGLGVVLVALVGANALPGSGRAARPGAAVR